MSKTKVVETGVSNELLNTEKKPIPAVVQDPAPCPLCKWFEKRLNNTLKEQIKHMEKYHVT